MRLGGVPGWTLGCLLLFGGAGPLLGQDLEPADVRVGLDSALGIAMKAARDAFPKLHDYLLYSITPRALKADPGGLHWQVRWQERTFPHHRWLIVRVYMKDGRSSSEQVDDSTVPSRRAN